MGVFEAMGLFFSTVICKVDKKGRASVPKDFRRALSDEDVQQIIVRKSFKAQCIEGCGTKHMEAMAEAAYNPNPFDDDEMAQMQARLIFADSRPLKYDDTGRVVLPTDLMEYAGIGDNVAFVGLGKTFQIWNPERLEKAQAEAFEKAKVKQGGGDG
ncbi:MAG: division/cell wall cluster transcriptional repressor MraZ [Alphaproteobacteria bacterium]|nr:division/cell wall cluster transcriptional repressor MraZ [Alphaproteobacteria bacterium]